MVWPFWENFNHCNSGLFIITRQKKERKKLKAPRMNTLSNDNKDQFCLNFNGTGTITNNNCKCNKGFDNNRMTGESDDILVKCITILHTVGFVAASNQKGEIR